MSQHVLQKFTRGSVGFHVNSCRGSSRNAVEVLYTVSLGLLCGMCVEFVLCGFGSKVLTPPAAQLQDFSIGLKITGP